MHINGTGISMGLATGKKYFGYYQYSMAQGAAESLTFLSPIIEAGYRGPQRRHNYSAASYSASQANL